MTKFRQFSAHFHSAVGHISNVFGQICLNKLSIYLLDKSNIT